MTEAYSFLHAHVLRFAPITESEWNALLGKTSCHEINARQTLVKEASRCRHIYFVAMGCLRLYYTKDNGMEQTSDFALEGWWLTDMNSFSTDKLSSFAIQAVESSRVVSIQRADYEELNNHYPLLAQYFRAVQTRALAAAQQRIKFLYSLSKEELFDQFNRAYPEFVKRVPQYMLASFLGFTPEYLSELRKRKRS